MLCHRPVQRQGQLTAIERQRDMGRGLWRSCRQLFCGNRLDRHEGQPVRWRARCSRDVLSVIALDIGIMQAKAFVFGVVRNSVFEAG